jgi:hypothetical protein
MLIVGHRQKIRHNLHVRRYFSFCKELRKKRTLQWRTSNIRGKIAEGWVLADSYITLNSIEWSPSWRADGPQLLMMFPFVMKHRGLIPRSREFTTGLYCEPVKFYVGSEVLTGEVKTRTIFGPEDGGYILRRNVGWLTTDHTAVYPRRCHESGPHFLALFL